MRTALALRTAVLALVVAAAITPRLVGARLVAALIVPAGLLLIGTRLGRSARRSSRPVRISAALTRAAVAMLATLPLPLALAAMVAALRGTALLLLPAARPPDLLELRFFRACGISGGCLGARFRWGGFGRSFLLIRWG